jgi:hypothetical protein
MKRNVALWALECRRGMESSEGLEKKRANFSYYVYIALFEACKALPHSHTNSPYIQSLQTALWVIRWGTWLIVNSLFLTIANWLTTNIYKRISFDEHQTYKIRTGVRHAKALQEENWAKHNAIGKTEMKLRSPKILFEAIRGTHLDELPQLYQWGLWKIAWNPNKEATQILLIVIEYLKKLNINLSTFSADLKKAIYDYISLVWIRPRETDEHEKYENAAREFFHTRDRKGLEFEIETLVKFVQKNWVGIFWPHYLFNGNFRADWEKNDFGDWTTWDILSFKQINCAYHVLRDIEQNQIISIHENRIIKTKGDKENRTYVLVYEKKSKRNEFTLDSHFIEQFSLKYLWEKMYQRLYKQHGYYIAALITVYQVIVGNRMKPNKKKKKTTETSVSLCYTN